MTGQWRHYSCNFWKICNIIGPIIVNKLIGSQCLVAQFLCTHFFLSCWISDVTSFLKVMKLVSSPKCYLRFSIVVPETLKFEWQCSQYLELNPTHEKYIVLELQNLTSYLVGQTRENCAVDTPTGNPNMKWTTTFPFWTSPGITAALTTLKSSLKVNDTYLTLHIMKHSCFSYFVLD